MSPGGVGFGNWFGTTETNAGWTSGRGGASTVLVRTWVVTRRMAAATRSSFHRGGGGGGSTTSMLSGMCRVCDADAECGHSK
jgi:hypothetical protein